MKTILITGCSSGFGLAMVQVFLKRGWTVIACIRNLEDRNDTLIQLSQDYPFDLNNSDKSNNSLYLQKLDLTVPEDIAAIQKLLLEKFNNRLDCLVNNAGFMLIGPLEHLSERQVRHQMEVNFFGSTLLIQTCLPALRLSKGRIINISSALGFAGLPLNSLYCASKFALEGLTESLYYELNPLEIQVALVEPGMHRSNLFEKIDFGERKTEGTDLYQIQERNLKFYRDKILGSKHLNNPQIVANTVLSLAEKKTMPLRTRVGFDANALYYLQRFLPRRLVNFLLKLLYNKIFTESVPSNASSKKNKKI